MDIKQLKYFLTIAEEGQITSAANRLHMAQPPLSQQLKALEDELGVRLVERGPRHTELTDAGKILKERAAQILELTDSAISEINDFRKGLRGTLSIGTVSSSGDALLNERMLEFHRLYSGVKFEIHEGNTFTILDMLERGLIEIGVVRTPFNNRRFICEYADSEPMIAAMVPEYDCCPEKNEITVEELKDKPLIFYRRFEQLIIETCIEHGFEPDILCRNDDARTTILWANEGLGLAIVPRSAFNLSKNSNLVFKEIKCKKLWTRIAAIRVRDRYITSLASKFMDVFSGRRPEPDAKE